MKNIKNILFIVLSIVLIITFTVTITFINKIYGDGDNCFLGYSGNMDLEDLYEETNTFQYSGPNSDGVSTYSYFDISNPLDDEIDIMEGTPQITVLTHGLNGAAYHWSNNGTNAFSYDSESLISRLKDEVTKNGTGAFVYWAVMKGQTSFELYDLNDSSNTNNLGNYTKTVATRIINDVSKHIIVVFQANYSNDYNYKIYEQFNYMLSKIVYDVKYLNDGALPKINLIGHSRGGLTNLEYVLDHPLMIGSVFSLGTPYFGSDSASFAKDAHIIDNCSGLTDIVNYDVYMNYFTRWNNGYTNLYQYIDYHALGGCSNIDFIFDVVNSFFASSHPILIPFCSAVHLYVKTSPHRIIQLSTMGGLYALFADMLPNPTVNEPQYRTVIYYLMSLLSDLTYIGLVSDDPVQNLYQNLINGLPNKVSTFFMNDALVDLLSQLGMDRQRFALAYYPFKHYVKCFNNNNTNHPYRLSNNNMPAAVHNLEARDEDFIDYIISNIEIGFTSPFIYKKTSLTTAKIIGYREDVVTSTLFIPNLIDNLTITELGTNFLRGHADNVTEIFIPATIESIYPMAFIGMYNLEKIRFNAGTPALTSIGWSAFAGCYSLNQFGEVPGILSFPAGVESIGYNAFMFTDFSLVSIHDNINYIGECAFSFMEDLSSITVSQNNDYYFSYNNTLYSYEGHLMQYASASNNTSYVLSNSIQNTDIEIIDSYAFVDAVNLANISLGSISEIGDYAFFGCSGIQNIIIPASMDKIGMGAFVDCGNLRSVIVNRAYAYITYLGEFAFDDCANDLSITVPQKWLGEYKNNEHWSDYSNKITSTLISPNSFYLNCHSNLEFQTILGYGMNEVYQLNVGCGKSYDFIFPNNVLIHIYDSNMNMINYGNGTISQYLSVGLYYIDIRYEFNTDNGIINTFVRPTWSNDIILEDGTINLLNHLHYCGDGTYMNGVYFNNCSGAGFYKFKMTGVMSDSSPIFYPFGAISIYADQLRTIVLQKYNYNGYINDAISKEGENYIIVYLNNNESCYIDIRMETNNLSLFTLELVELNQNVIDLFDTNENGNTLMPLLSSQLSGDFIQELVIKQTGKFTINVNYVGFSEDYILFVFKKKVYNNISQSYEFINISSILLDSSYNTETITRTLSEGVYFIGYLNKDNNSTFNITFNRLITDSGSSVLLVDPGSDWYCGSEINIIERFLTNKSYNSTFITEGFTRIIYINIHYGLSDSRLDYYWYSSDEEKATVTDYGTVFGRSAGIVKIMAVLKTDASKAFVKTFSIIEDDGTGYQNIESNYNVSLSDTLNGRFHLELENVLCPYPIHQYYTWNISNVSSGLIVSEEEWGDYSVSDVGTFDLVGTNYIYNTIFITIVITIHVTVTND